jgi:hypothetical protein
MAGTLRCQPVYGTDECKLARDVIALASEYGRSVGQ